MDRMGGLSRRTIHRWMKYLRELEENYYSFDYLTRLKFNNLGLVRVDVVVEDPAHRDISLLIPHNYYHNVMRTPSMKSAQNIVYLIPPDMIGDLRDLHDLMGDQGLISGHDISIVRDSTYIPSPFHEIISSEGIIHFEGGIDNSFFIDRMSITDRPVTIIDEIRKDPFIIPVLFEGDKDTFSYRYLSRMIMRRDLSSYPGMKELKPDQTAFENRVKEIQLGTMKDGNPFHDYVMIYNKPMFDIEDCMFHKCYFRNSHVLFEDLKNLIKEISQKSVFLVAYLSYDLDGNEMIMLHLHSKFSKIFQCLKDIKREDPGMVHYFVDGQRTMEIMDREHAKFFYWELFDPVNVRWRFDTDDYEKRINNFARDLRKGQLKERETFTW